MTRAAVSPFLKAIVADPDDDAPRLIYADWLDEEGDGLRAEFIRLQCALDRMPVDDPQRPELQEREQELLRGHAAVWLGPLKGLFYLAAFRRGFLEEITLPARLFLKNATKIFNLGPVRLVRLLQLTPVINGVAACRHLRRVSALHLTGTGIGDLGVQTLAASPHLGGLQTLRLGNTNVGPEGVEALANSARFAGLKALNLNDNPLGLAGLRALGQSPHLANLTVLELGGIEIRESGVRALIESPYLRSLRCLDFSGGNYPLRHGLTPSQMKTLCQRFGKDVCRF